MRFHNSISRELVGFFGSSSLLVEPMKRLFLNHTPIVLYHFVGTKPQTNASLVGPSLDEFEGDLKFLKKYFEFATLSEILSYNADSRACAAPPLAITFDDGFDVVRSGAVEVLRAYNIKATLFVITSCLDNRNLMWSHKLQAITATKNEATCVRNYNELMTKFNLPQISGGAEFMSESRQWPYRLKELLADELWSLCDMPPLEEYLNENRPYLSERDLDSLLLEGHQVGLHTHTHPFCSQLDPEDVRFEIAAPAFYLSKRFGLRAVPLAYPFGDRLDNRAERALYDAGTISCALGNKGFQRRGVETFRLERSSCDNGVSFPVLGESPARMAVSIPRYGSRFPEKVLG